MNTYELIYVLKPDITDQDIGSIRSDIKNSILEIEGKIEKEDDWGKRQLGFEIKDCFEGIYTFVEVQLPPENSNKLRDKLKIDERIIRFMLTRADKIKTTALRKQKTEA